MWYYVFVGSGDWRHFVLFADTNGEDGKNIGNHKGADDEPVKIDFLSSKREADVKVEDLDDKADIKRIKEDGEILLDLGLFN